MKGKKEEHLFSNFFLSVFWSAHGITIKSLKTDRSRLHYADETTYLDDLVVILAQNSFTILLESHQLPTGLIETTVLAHTK